MSLAFAETDDYAEIVDEEDTYTMPSSKSPDSLLSDVVTHSLLRRRTLWLEGRISPSCKRGRYSPSFARKATEAKPQSATFGLVSGKTKSRPLEASCVNSRRSQRLENSSASWLVSHYSCCTLSSFGEQQAKRHNHAPEVLSFYAKKKYYLSCLSLLFLSSFFDVHLRSVCVRTHVSNPVWLRLIYYKAVLKNRWLCN